MILIYTFTRLIFIDKYIKNNICVFTVPKYSVLIQLSNIERNWICATTYNFNTLVVHHEMFHSKVGLSMTSLLIRIRDNTKLHSTSQYLLWCKRSSRYSYRQPSLIRNLRISECTDWYRIEHHQYRCQN